MTAREELIAERRAIMEVEKVSAAEIARVVAEMYGEELED
jgi:hypothetical protein